MAALVGAGVVVHRWYRELDPPAWVVATAIQWLMFFAGWLTFVLSAGTPWLYQQTLW